MAEKENKVGQVTGLAWTAVGGDLLTIEVADMPGKGVVLRTGSLGDVMKESVEAARTAARARAQKRGIANTGFCKRGLPVHFTGISGETRGVTGYVMTFRIRMCALD